MSVSHATVSVEAPCARAGARRQAAERERAGSRRKFQECAPIRLHFHAHPSELPTTIQSIPFNCCQSMANQWNNGSSEFGTLSIYGVFGFQL